MALRGNLKDFSLPDVFQLIQLSRKTGVLRIRSGAAAGSIWFRDGDVFFAQSDWRADPLGQRLVSAEKITPSALARALEARRAEPAGGRRLGRILVDEGYITQKVLESFVQEQIQDTIFDLMRWDEGEFDFEALPAVDEEDIGLSVSIENIVMEGSRRLEEWNRIKKKVPSMEMVFKMATAPGEGTFEISLKPVEWGLLLLVDGTRSVAELARETRHTDFEVARVIYGLFSAGLLEVAADDEVARLRAAREEREARQAARRTVAPAPAVVSEPAAVADEPIFDDEPVATPMTPAASEPLPSPEPQPVATSAAPVDLTPIEPEPTVEPQPRPHEEPAFLSAPPSVPNADDMAVFEQMMSAVLTGPAEKPAPEAEPETVPEPQPEPMAELEPAVEPEVAPSPEPRPEPVAQPRPEPEPVSFDFGALSMADLDQIPRPPISEDDFTEGGLAPEPGQGTQPEAVPAAPSGFVPTGDLAADLLSLGLGELPVKPELEPSLEPEASAPIAMPEPEPESFAPSISMSDSDFVTPAPPEKTPEVEPEGPVTPSTGEDLDALLRSLGAPDEPSPDAPGLSLPAEPPLVSPAPGSSAPNVISTDAYLADFEPDVGLNSGLGDEIAALTGGDESRARPSVVVNPLPESRPEAGPVLHRDDVVDRDLLLKIIEGIEKL